LSERRALLLMCMARTMVVSCRVSQCCRTRACRTKRSVQSNEEESHKLLDYYVEERGGNFIDVAEMYPAPASDPRWMPGASEEIIGRWFAKKPEVRSKVILATKVGVPPALMRASTATSPFIVTITQQFAELAVNSVDLTSAGHGLQPRLRLCWQSQDHAGHGRKDRRKRQAGARAGEARQGEHPRGVRSVPQASPGQTHTTTSTRIHVRARTHAHMHAHTGAKYTHSLTLDLSDMTDFLHRPLPAPLARCIKPKP